MAGLHREEMVNRYTFSLALFLCNVRAPMRAFLRACVRSRARYRSAIPISTSLGQQERFITALKFIYKKDLLQHLVCFRFNTALRYSAGRLLAREIPIINQLDWFCCMVDDLLRHQAPSSHRPSLDRRVPLYRCLCSTTPHSLTHTRTSDP